MKGVHLRTNLDAFRRGLSDAHRRQVPFALAAAVNDMAARAGADIKASMQTTFDQPRPYTLGAVFTTRATKSNLRAVVGLKDAARDGSTPAWKYLAPEIDGGERRRKRFEIALGLGGYAVPGPGAKLDGSGDLSRAQIGQILAALGQGAALRSPSQAKIAGRKGRLAYRGAKGGKPPYFVARAKGSGKPLAVYQVVGKGQVRAVLLLEQDAPTYRPRWNLQNVVLSSLERSRVGAFERAWAKALETART